MDIISLRGDAIAPGQFVADATMIGASKEECLCALMQTHAFAMDAGPSTREDSYVDESGTTQVSSVTIYVMLGGSIR